MAAAKEAALLGKTSDDLLGNVFAAAQINRASGGAVIAPWEISQVPDDWLEACLAATVEMDQWYKLKKDGGING